MYWGFFCIQKTILNTTLSIPILFELHNLIDISILNTDTLRHFTTDTETNSDTSDVSENPYQK